MRGDRTLLPARRGPWAGSAKEAVMRGNAVGAAAMSVMRRLAIAIALGGLVLPGSGCGGDSTGPVEDITGFYEIQSYDGHKLPQQRGDGIAWWGELILNRNGTFSLMFVASTTPGNIGHDGGGGTYVRNGNQLEFRIKYPGALDQVLAGTISGTTITIEFTVPVVYRRVLAR